MIADLHIHSRYSRATSPECTLEGLHYWAQLKGVTVVGTGDATHPEWFAELARKLEPAAPGLYRLRAEFAAPVNARVPERCRAPVYFLVTAEISSIYKRAGKGRRVHSLLLLPELAVAAALNTRLNAIGNLKSDGRPILGLDPQDLLKILLACSPEAELIPAHIWTPWFAMLGSKSGFDSLEACFGELTPQIHAVETGLSSDPPMNWRVSFLDRRALVSNSDLHSPSNLARNATVFHTAPDYAAMLQALRTRDAATFGGTLDLFPEEGKYHLDGHRDCGVVLLPEASVKLGELCPACGRPLTLGVLHRVVDLADRPAGVKPPGAAPCRYIVPLPEILGELAEAAPTAKKVLKLYAQLLTMCGPELPILLELPPEAVAAAAGLPRLATALQRLRAGAVTRQPGYDGEYGVIRVLP